MAPALPVGERRLRHVFVSWAALKQATACQYLCICGIETKAQGCVENLITVKISATGLDDECAADAGVEGIIYLDQHRLR